MAKDKKSFILYCDLIHEIDHLTDEEKGKLFQHLLEYVNDMNPVLEDRVLLGTWKPLQNKLKRDLKKFEEIKDKRRLAGAKGGKQKQANLANATKTKQSKTNLADSVSVSDNVNDSVSDILLEKEKKDLFMTWVNYRKEIKKPIKAESTKISLAKKIQSESYERCKSVIDASIQNGYQGLFWNSNAANSKKTDIKIEDLTDDDYP